MKLAELLSNITPLPWNEDTPFASRGDQYWADQSYRHHAANVLPELVEALRELDAATRSAARLRAIACGKKLEDAENRETAAYLGAQSVLARAEEVEVEFPAVPRPSQKKTVAVSETATAGPVAPVA